MAVVCCNTSLFTVNLFVLGGCINGLAQGRGEGHSRDGKDGKAGPPPWPRSWRRTWCRMV